MKKFFIYITAFVLLCTPFLLRAEGTGTPTPSGGTNVNIQIKNPLNCKTATDNQNCTLFDLIATIMNKIVMPIMGVLVVLYIIYAGFRYVQAQGNPGAISKANDNLKYALIGAGILLAAAGISQVVQNTVTSLLN